MLVASHRHTILDLALWAELERADRVAGGQLRLHQKAAASRRAVQQFLEHSPAGCYCSVSWGKDSVVLAHLVVDLDSLPLVWVRQEPVYNPDCLLVRDAMLARYPRLAARYDEIVVRLRRGVNTWHATGSLESGFAVAVERHGPRYVLGLRADESAGRKLRCRTHGTASKTSCAPLAWWKAADVFAWLAVHDLPVHPAYGCLGGGRWDRFRLRVCSLGQRGGTGFGRSEWEHEYYGEELRRLRHLS